MPTPYQLAALIPEDVTDTFMVLREDGLWHRRQRGGTRFDGTTPLDVVLNFMTTQATVSRYDLQSFLDHLRDVIAGQTEEMCTLAREHINLDSTDPDNSNQNIVNWLEHSLGGVADLLSGVVPVLRRSQAQATSGTHASALLQRHMDRLTTSIQQIQDTVPPELIEIMDLVHTVAGGILQACEVIRDELINLLWPD